MEAPTVNEFRKQIVLYKTYTDDILLIWSGSYAELRCFRVRFGSANDNLKLEWQSTLSSVDTINPVGFAQDQHRRVSFLKLDLRLEVASSLLDRLLRFCVLKQVMPTHIAKQVIAKQVMPMHGNAYAYRKTGYRKTGNAYAYFEAGSKQRCIDC